MLHIKQNCKLIFRLTVVGSLVDEHAGVRWEGLLANTAQPLARALLGLLDRPGGGKSRTQLKRSTTWSRIALLHQDTVVGHCKLRLGMRVLNVPNPFGWCREMNVLAQVA